MKDVAPGPEDVWNYGIANGLFTPDEEENVKDRSRSWASESYDERYAAARAGHIHGAEKYYDQSGGNPSEDPEIWERGVEYNLFLPSEKARVLRIPPLSALRAITLTAKIKNVKPGTPEADKIIDDIHNFTREPGVVLLGPEVGKLLGPFGYTYSDEATQGFAAEKINDAWARSRPPGQKLKSRNASVEALWNESMREQGLGDNNLEAARFDPAYLSEADYLQEWLRRSRLYLELLQRCGDSGPRDIECRNSISAEYFPMHTAWHDAAIAEIRNDLDIYQGVVEGGLVSQLSFYFGFDVLEWSPQRSAALAGAVNTAAGIAGLSVERYASLRNTPSNPQQPRTPIGQMVEQAEPMPMPDQPQVDVDRRPVPGGIPEPVGAQGDAIYHGPAPTAARQTTAADTSHTTSPPPRRHQQQQLQPVGVRIQEPEPQPSRGRPKDEQQDRREQQHQQQLAVVGAIRPDDIAARGYPLGFKSRGQFQQFGAAARGTLNRAGFVDGQVGIQGSAVTGVSASDGRPFDVGRVSDFDVAVVSPSLFAEAKSQGVTVVASGARPHAEDRTAFALTPDQAASLGVGDLALAKTWGHFEERTINIMVFASHAAAIAKQPHTIWTR